MPTDWGLSYAYDRYGNLLTRSVTQGSAPALSVAVNSKNRITNAGFSYDAAGNMTADGSGSLAYDAENRMTSAAGVGYTYDGDGRRVKKSNGMLYWYGLSGEVLLETNSAGNNPTEYMFFNGQRMARRDPSGSVFYYFEDHLGTSRVIVQDGQEQPCYEADFYPFGGERVITDTCPQNYKFTGQERDSESGLDYFIARHYASTLGRFLQVDPLMGDLRRPQSLNRYTYVMNNPLKLIDPTGLLGIDFSECPEPKAFCSEIDQNKVKDETVAVDPGHGSPSSENSPPAPGAVANGLVERNLTLALANAVTAELNRMGINVIQTRNGDVTTFPGTANLWRVQLAEEGGASIFVSIHLNSGDGEGIEILHNQLGKTLAESILNANTVFKRRPKAIIDANGRGFTVLDRFSGPSVIVEAGFISNRSDVGKMKNRTLKIGKEIATGIKHYLEKQ